MIKHLLTLIWNQRNGNVWIFLELLLVTAMLWVMADSLLVDTYTYQQPLGYDISEYRADMLKPRLDNQKKKIAMVGFMLVNIFFGIVGTFWLRTQSRRAEIGLRAALGASKRQLRRELFLEGLFLLALTLPLLLIFLVNMLYLDMPDTYRLAYTWWRFLITLSVSYLLMGGMIYMGIRIPANKITRMSPAETLHYE